MAVIGTAEVRVVPDAKGFGQSLTTQVEKPAKDVFSRVGALAAGAFAARTAVTFFADLANAAGDAAETASKAEVVFGSANRQVEEFAEGAPEAIGLSSQAAQEAAGTYGNLFRAIGLSEQASADMSTSMIQLAGDLASFNNADPTEVLEALRSGLVGETEPLRRFGINLNEAAVRQEALNLGLDVGSGVLDSATKAQATYSLIMQQTSLAQGDFERTSGGLANQQRILAAEWANAKVELGQGLAPVMVQLIGIARDELLPAIIDLGESAVPLLASSFSAATPLLGTGLDILLALAPAVSVVAGALDAIPDPILQLAALTLTANQGIGRVVGGVSGLATTLKGLGTIVHDVPVPYDEWAKSAKRGEGALGGLVSKTQAAAGAAGLAFAAYSLVAAELDRAAQAAEAFGDKVQDKLAQGLADTTDPLAFIDDRIGRLDAGIQDLSDTIDGSSAPWDADFRHELGLGREELEAQRDALEANRTEVERLAGQYGISAEEAARFAQANGIDLLGATEDVTTQFNAAWGEAASLARETDAVGAASAQTTEELEAEVEALDALTEAVLGSASASIAYQEASTDTEDALAELFLAQEAIRLGSEDTAEEQRALEEAMRGAESAALDQAEAALRNAEEMAAAAGETLTWQQKNEILQAELLNVAATLAPDSPLRARLGTLIGQLGSVPGVYAATITADISQAQVRLNALSAQLTALAITGVIVQPAPGSVARFAGGGFIGDQYVHGTMGAGDVVPAVLTPGEYVVRRPIVDSIGRAFFEMLNRGGRPPGYADGGLVGGGPALGSLLGNLQTGGSTRTVGRDDRALLQAVRSIQPGDSVTLVVPPGASLSPVSTAVELHRRMRRDQFRRRGR